MEVDEDDFHDLGFGVADEIEVDDGEELFHFQSHFAHTRVALQGFEESVDVPHKVVLFFLVELLVVVGDDHVEIRLSRVQSRRMRSGIIDCEGQSEVLLQEITHVREDSFVQRLRSSLVLVYVLDEMGYLFLELEAEVLLEALAFRFGKTDFLCSHRPFDLDLLSQVLYLLLHFCYLLDERGLLFLEHFLR